MFLTFKGSKIAHIFLCVPRMFSYFRPNWTVNAINVSAQKWCCKCSCSSFKCVNTRLFCSVISITSPLTWMLVISVSEHAAPTARLQFKVLQSWKLFLLPCHPNLLSDISDEALIISYWNNSSADFIMWCDAHLQDHNISSGIWAAVKLKHKIRAYKDKHADQKERINKVTGTMWVRVEQHNPLILTTLSFGYVCVCTHVCVSMCVGGWFAMLSALSGRMRRRDETERQGQSEGEMGLGERWSQKNSGWREKWDACRSTRVTQICCT